MKPDDPDFWEPEIPDKVVTDYSPEELAAFRKYFAPAAKHYRQRSWKLLPWGILIALFTLSFVASDNLGVRDGAAKMLLFAGSVVCSFIFIFLKSRLDSPHSPQSPSCPACDGKITFGIGAFCPECGSKSVHPGHRPNWHHCNACSRHLHVYKGSRQYKVRACTHCGVMLDDKGL